jgi:hypothetical protein
MVSNLYHMREEKLIIRKGTIFDVLVHNFIVTYAS